MKENLIKYLNQYGSEMISAMKQILVDKGKGNSNFIKTLNYRIEADVDVAFIQFEMEDYGKYLDRGRGPGKQPPLDVIKNWCVRNRIPEKAAFPIARKIGKFGLPGTNFLDPLRNTNKEFLENINKLITEEISNSLDEKVEKK